MHITRETKVGATLDAYPETLEVFLQFGFTPLKNEAIRKKVAGKVSIAKACMVKAVKPGELIHALNEKINTINRDT